MKESITGKKKKVVSASSAFPVSTMTVVVFLLLCFLLLSCASSPVANTNVSTSARILVFSKTAGFRHISIKNGLSAIYTMATEHHIVVDATEDATVFTLSNLKHYKAIVFLSTTGTILNSEQKKAFEQYIHNGGGYVGIHSASDTEYNWPWYGQLVGAYFKSHPSFLQQATITVEDTHHVSTSMLPHTWERADEWYNFRANPRDHVHVLLTLNETTYRGGTMGSDHPISWYHDFDGTNRRRGNSFAVPAESTRMLLDVRMSFAHSS